MATPLVDPGGASRSSVVASRRRGSSWFGRFVLQSRRWMAVVDAQRSMSPGFRRTLAPSRSSTRQIRHGEASLMGDTHAGPGRRPCMGHGERGPHGARRSCMPRRRRPRRRRMAAPRCPSHRSHHARCDELSDCGRPGHPAELALLHPAQFQQRKLSRRPTTAVHRTLENKYWFDEFYRDHVIANVLLHREVSRPGSTSMSWMGWSMARVT